MAREIVYLEHDSYQFKFGLEDFGLYGNVSVIETEHDYRQHIDSLVQGKGLWPSLVILDWRVPWTKPAREMVPAPEDVKSDGYFENAGARCLDYLRKAELAVGRVTPVLFYSVLEQEDIFGKLAERGYTPQQGKFDYLSKDVDDWKSKSLNDVVLGLLRN